MSPQELRQAVHDNLRNLGLEVLDVVNFRSIHGVHEPSEGPIGEQVSVLADMQQEGLVRHIGLSSVTPAQVAEGRWIAEIVCVQNQYNLAHRRDDALIDELARDGIAYVPFFPLGGFTPLQSVDAVRGRRAARRHADAGGARLAAAPRPEHPADPRHLVAGASARRTSPQPNSGCRRMRWARSTAWPQRREACAQAATRLAAHMPALPRMRSGSA